MKAEQEMVKEFMEKANQSYSSEPIPVPFEARKYASKLIQTELLKFLEAETYKDSLGALCEILYVIFWLGNKAGFNLTLGFSLLHESNMSRFVRTPEGWSQGLTYNPPDYEKVS